MSGLIATLAAHHRLIVPASTGWWLPAGIVTADVEQALQPKGATNYASSLVCKAGKQNASAGSDPTWNATDGWVFNGTSQYLESGVTPVTDGTWSAFCRYVTTSTTTDQYLIGLNGTDYDEYRAIRWRLELDYDTSNRVVTVNGANYDIAFSQQPTSGVLGFSGSTPYHSNGTTTWTPQTDLTYDIANRGFLIGNTFSNGVSSVWFKGSIQALVVYNKTLTPTQANALMTAMLAL